MKNGLTRRRSSAEYPDMTDLVSKAASAYTASGKCGAFTAV
jgi:hypothetical protein